MTQERFDIFLSAPPGLEGALRAEALGAGFSAPALEAGGVSFKGRWQDAMRANLVLRGASRVLVRIDSFPAVHLSQLDKSLRKVDWARFLVPGVPVKVDVTCKASKLYHGGAVQQRVERVLAAIMRAPAGGEEALQVKVRIERNICTISLDTSGELLHKRGHKVAVNKAPMRETMAALFLRECGYSGDEPVLDPMCGSGTFVIEAAEIAAGLVAGRSRGFAFQQMANFDPELWQALKDKAGTGREAGVRFYGSDRDEGAIRMSRENAERAGVSGLTQFDHRSVSDISAPDGPAGLVIVNPPYGARIGDKKQLFALYSALGRSLTERFKGWRVGIITTDSALAKSTNLPFLPDGPVVPHGGLKVRLYKTASLK